ncbi:RNA polymerase sigma factor [Planctomycetota bacterium]
MSENPDFLALVIEAKAGDKESLNRLAEMATGRLHEFVYRQTLQEDLTQDIVQETIVEMLQVFNKLRHVERFWYWLYGIAYNKLRRHYSKKKRRRAASLSDIPYEVEGKKGDETVANVVSHELKQVVLQSMEDLDPRHRSILTMRCYDQMSYAEIAELMDCTEFGARALFYRAKKSLAKKLASHGLGKGALLTGLMLFGKMTAVNEASAAGVSITASTLQVGTVAAVAASATSKAALVAITAGALATGTMVSPWSPLHTPSEQESHGAIVSSTNDIAKAPTEVPILNNRWIFFPDGPGGAVMLRTEALAKDVETRWEVLQNAGGNFQWQGAVIRQTNYHWFNPDLHVLRLPTDSTQLRLQLTEMDGYEIPTAPVKKTGNNLLIICGGDNSADSHHVRAVRHHNVLIEDYFQAHCPAGVSFSDERDVMRKRGWAYFTVDGHLAGEPITGSGRVPFVYATLERYRPWLELRVGDSLRVVDTGAGAAVESGGEEPLRRYPSGSFTQGLARPWMGLHVLDSVRRDAARSKIPFVTERLDDGHAKVTLVRDSITLVYTIDLYNDLVDGIEWVADGQRLGLLYFTYQQESYQGNWQFREPVRPRGVAAQHPGPGMGWLFALGQGSL